MEETSSKKSLIYFTGITVVIAVIALFLIKKCAIDQKDPITPDQQAENSDSIDQLKNANRQAEILMRKHAKMQTGFEKVIFAILQNCPP